MTRRSVRGRARANAAMMRRGRRSASARAGREGLKGSACIAGERRLLRRRSQCVVSGEDRVVGHVHIGEVARRHSGRRSLLSDRGIGDAMGRIVSRLEDLGVVNGVDGTSENPVPNKVTEVHVVGRSHEARERKGLA